MNPWVGTSRLLFHSYPTELFRMMTRIKVINLYFDIYVRLCLMNLYLTFFGEF